MADREQRLEALKSDRSVIVQAPAGSGKTELLTQRYLKLLGQVDSPEQVLAITFTRKATHEMRERILRRLQQAAGELTAEAAHERLAIDFAGRVLERDLDRGWEVLANPGRLQIHTIDGLCARIAARSPRSGGLAGLGISDDPQPLYRRAATRLIEDFGAAGRMQEFHDALCRALRHLHGDTQRLLALLVDMLARRDQWLAALGHDHARMNSLLEHLQRDELGRLETVLGQGQLDELRMALARLAHHADQRDSAESLLEEMHSHDPGTTPPAGRVRAMRALLSAMVTRDGKPYKPRSATRIMPGSGDSRDADIAVIREVLAAWHEDARAPGAIQRFLSGPPLAGPGDNPAVLGDFRMLLKAAAAELEVLFVDEGRADFVYLADLAMRALGEDLQPGEALLIEDGKLAHILMDEFQDTSQTQYELLRRLVSGWQPGDGRTLFLVGDPMQSIYRFRQAEVRLFQQVFASGRLADLELQRLVLSSNFRSRSEIIDWVNGQCGRIFGAPENGACGAVAYTPVNPARPAGGRVQLAAWPEAAGDAREAEQITRLVQQRLEERPAGDIAILARKRAQLVPIAEALRRAGIRFDAVELETLGESPAVLGLMAFTRAIVHPADRVAWLALLRGPWCGLTPAEMHDLLGDDPAGDVFATIRDKAALARLSTTAAERVQHLSRVLAQVIAARGEAPLHQLVEAAWVGSRAPLTAASAWDLQSAQAFIDLLARTESAGSEDLITTLEEQLDKYLSASRSAPVQLMTIHKAKGLEFDTVMLPGLHQTVGGFDQPLLRIQEVHRDNAHGVLLAPLKRRGAGEAHLYDYLGLLDRDEESSEARRTLYVALTRAREQLYLFGGWRMTGSAGNRVPGCRRGTFMHMLWPCFEPLVEADGSDDATLPESGSPRPLPQLRLTGTPATARPAWAARELQGVAELRLPDADATALGDAFHQWLELMHDHWDRGWTADWFQAHPEALASTLRRAGASGHRVAELGERLQSMLRATLESPLGSYVVGPDGKRDSWSELPLYSRDGNVLRRHVMDRVYREHGPGWLLLDYKTGEPDERAREGWNRQLARYRDLLQRCTGADVTHCAVYRPGAESLLEFTGDG
jgi:ATP-dependent exoDNAse (exonuclease V) beta subunit